MRDFVWEVVEGGWRMKCDYLGFDLMGGWRTLLANV